MTHYHLIIDGGTTNLRVTLLDTSGTIINTIKIEAGVSHTPMA